MERPSGAKPPHRRRFRRGHGGGGPDSSSPRPVGWKGRVRQHRGLLLVTGTVVAVLVVIAATEPGWLGLKKSPPTLVASANAVPSAEYAPADVRVSVTVHGGVPPYSVDWTDGGSPLGHGLALSVSLVIPGNHSITAVVTDSAGAVTATSIVVRVVSTFPEASYAVPPAISDTGPTLTLRWSSSALVSACLLPGYGAIAVPPFATCAAAGGVSTFGVSDAHVFATDPDDPEGTPALFQSSAAGVTISFGWWYNTTAGTETSGATSLTTAVEAL